MAKKNTNMPGAVRGLGKFSKLDRDDAAFARKQPTAKRAPAGKSKILDVSGPQISGGMAFRPLGSARVKKFYGN